MKNILITYIIVYIIIIAICSISCSKDSEINTNKELETVEVVDTFKHLTPCLIDIVTNFSDYVINDTIPHNDSFGLERILLMEVDLMKYYWLKTDWFDENEFILTEECEIFCEYGGWTGFQDNCLSEFRDSLWSLAWIR